MLRLHGLRCLMALACLTIQARATDEGIEFFEKRIRPVLAEHCYRCHAAEFNEAKGGLTVDTREGLQRGGESGPAVVPGSPEDSLLLEALRYESLEMPPSGPLTKAQIADFETWISMGAPDPRDTVAMKISSREAVQIDWPAARQFWAFQKPRQEHPELATGAVIDLQVRTRLNEHQLSPNPPATPQVLLRRLCLTLTGLPPAPEQSAAFLAAAEQNRDAAVSELTSSLLASPQFGEHWAAMWLDISRYAEDQAHIVGDDKALFFPNAWRYRDWVISAFNTDLPYDQFVRLQLAADMVTPDDPADDVALGFIGLGPKYYRRNAPDVMADEWEDRVDVVTRGLLGLTVACARCHDHKFDPIPTEDYYALAGVFASTEMWNRPLNADTKAEKNGHASNPDEALHIIRDQKVRDVNVYIRGNVENPGEIVPRRFLQILCDAPPVPFAQGSGRLELAEQIISPDNPLAARVIVNRVWAALFGRGLAGTPSNFGALGERPTHPVLLDELASRLMQNNWSLKWLISEVVATRTWQQSSDLQAAAMEADPANLLLWRMNRRRLTVEQWRDSLLSVSGRLAADIGGKSIQPDAPDGDRRTVYSERSRFQLNPLLAMYDLPDPNAHAASRIRTTTPLQKLFVLNHPFMEHQATALAELIRTQTTELPDQIDLAYQRVYLRQPLAEERSLGVQFVENNGWELYAQALLAANEFLILD